MHAAGLHRQRWTHSAWHSHDAPHATDGEVQSASRRWRRVLLSGAALSLGATLTMAEPQIGAASEIFVNDQRLVLARNPSVAEDTEFDVEAFVNEKSGVIDIADGNDPGVRDTVTINGKYIGVPGSRIEMDLALTADRNPHTDTDLIILDPQNRAEGTSDLVFNIVSTGKTASTRSGRRTVFEGGQLLDEPVTVVQDRGDLTTSSGATDIPLARSGMVLYDLVNPGHPGHFKVVSRLHETLGGGILLPISATLAAVAFTTQRSPSPITATCIDPETKPHAQAGWLRAFGGEARTEAAGEAVGGGAVSKLTTSNRTRFATLQGGFDGVLCDLDGHGGNLHLGVTLGHTWGESRQTKVDGAGIFGTDVDFDSFFVGPYAAYTRGNLAVLASLRFDHHQLELTNPTMGIAVDRLKVDGSSISGSTAVSYDVVFDQLTVTPEVGVNVSNTRIDDFPISGGTVVLDDLLSVMGHAGVTARTTVSITDNVFASPFASGTVFHEFIDDAKARFTSGLGSVEAESNRVGTFGQIGVGVNVIRLGNVAAGRPTLFGGARTDLQFGDRLKGFTATVFGRIQF